MWLQLRSPGRFGLPRKVLQVFLPRAREVLCEAGHNALQTNIPILRPLEAGI
jgi:hypothetical protein